MEAARGLPALEKDIIGWKQYIYEDEALLGALEEKFGSLSKAKQTDMSKWSEELKALVTHGTRSASGTIKKAVDRRDRGKTAVRDTQKRIDELRQSGGSRISKGGRKVKSKRSVKSKKNKRSKRK